MVGLNSRLRLADSDWRLSCASDFPRQREGRLRLRLLATMPITRLNTELARDDGQT